MRVQVAGDLPSFRPFQLATLSEQVPVGPQWLFEVKFDGYRAQVSIRGSSVKVFTRNGHDWTRQFQTILDPLKRLTEGSALIDGEICLIDDLGRTNFSKLKVGIGAGEALTFFAFDLLEIDGRDLTKLPLTERKTMLEQLIGAQPSASALQYSAHIFGDGKKALAAMCAGGHEGLIAKRADARYVGDRTQTWLKLKCTKRQEFVVGGWRPSDTGRGLASLIVGTYEDGVLVYRGRVGTGFSDKLRRELLEILQSRALAKAPFTKVPRDIARTAKWSEPLLVAEIAFTELTADGIRHPSFIGLRQDKDPKDVHLERPV